MDHVRVNGVRLPAIDLVLSLLSSERLPTNRGVPVSLNKRLPFFVALVAVLSLGSGSQVEAQGHRGAHGRSVVAAVTVLGQSFWFGYGYP